MFAFKIIESEIKDFMNKLLREETFDCFEVRGVEISSFTKFQISGALDKDALPEDSGQKEIRGYCTWNEIRPYVFNIIKGGKRPKQIKVIFSLPPNRFKPFITTPLHFFSTSCSTEQKPYVPLQLQKKTFPWINPLTAYGMTTYCNFLRKVKLLLALIFNEC